ncbi:MAG: chorismate mutase, partial [Thermoguttaceae bacterium]|nr:chorismate mutase [Thermoguttaceae bacterium]
MMNLQEIDQEILRLMELRAALVTGMKTDGKKRPAALLDPDKKEDVLRDVRSLCDALVKPKKVAFLGPFFSFSH